MLQLTPDQIAEMVDSGLVEFGAHTLHHSSLLSIDDRTAFAEISASKLIVEELTGRSCQSFAYPYGRYNSRHVAMVQQAGFSSAVTVRKIISPLINNFEIPRIGIPGTANIRQFHIAFTRGRYRL